MDANSPYKKVRYVFSSCWVDPSVRYHLPLFERHIKFGQFQCNVFSTFREANGKRQSLIPLHTFLILHGMKINSWELYINCIARENQSADYNSFLAPKNI